MSFKRKIALLLAITMLFTVLLVACSDKSDDNPNWTPPADTITDNLPALDYDGYEAQIFYRGQDFYEFYECEGNNDPETRNIIYISVYERNRKVEARLDCKLNYVPSANGGPSETASEINQILMKQDFYDFICTTNNTSLSLGQNVLLADLSMTRYIDLDQPWWWTEVYEELSYDGYSINFICGDMNIINILKMSAFYFNQRLCNEYLQMVPKDFYDLVDNKQWTLEKLRTLSDVYFDTGMDPNGTNKADQLDILAFPYVTGGETLSQLAWSTRVVENMYTRNSNGTIAITLNTNEDVNPLVEEMRKLIHNTKGAWKVEGGYDSTIIKSFSENNYLFLPQRLSAVCDNYMREMEADFGILPYPTLEEGDDYVSHIQGSSTSICIPAIVESNDEDIDRASAIIEALGSEAYRSTTEAFYETALKNRYTRDDDARRMIDIIYESADKNFLIEYENQANGIAYQVINAIWADESATSYLASAKSGEAAINKFILDTIKKTQQE